jgi:CRP-like cAMP-binding protein
MTRVRDRQRHKDSAALTGRALRNAGVRGVVAGFAGVTLGEWVLGTTVAVHAYSVGGALAVGLVGFRFAPAALAGLWTTSLADHAQRHRVLALTAAGRAAATALASFGLALHLPFAIVIALVWLDAAIGSAYRPAQAALLPALVRTPGELTAATALLSNVKTSGQLVGALLGGVLVAALPIPIPVAIAAILYVAAMTLTAGIRRARPFVTAGSGLRGLRAGVHALSEGRETRLIVIYACLRSLMRGLWLALAVVASLEVLSLGKAGFGILMAAAAAGALAAMLATGRLVGNRRLADWFALGLVLCGLPIAAIGIVASAAPAVALIIVWGLGMSLSDVGAQTLLNRIVPGHSIGPVTGAMESGKLLFEGLGSLVAPLLLAVFSTRGALLVAGCALPLVVLLGRSSFARVDDLAVARQDVLELVQRVPFFTPLPLDVLEGVAARLRIEHHRAGEEIVRQGETNGRLWYLVDEGELVVEVEGFLVGDLRRGDQFGERSLLRGVPRAATVRARTDVVLHTLERDEFLSAVAGVALHETDGRPATVEPLDPPTALAGAPLVQSLGAAAVARLLDGSRVQTVEAGVPIVSIDERDDTYHVLLSGCAHVVVDGVIRQELLPGDAFGEIAVLHRVPRTANVIAIDRSTILTISGETVRSAVRAHGGGPLAALAG